jgi:hypothetical protein
MASTEETGAPRCDKHKVRMVKVRISYPDIKVERSAFQCVELDCTRYFTDVRGYIDVVDGSVLAEKFQQRCPKCNGPMYFSETEQDIEIWRCPLSQCGHEQRMVA